MEPFDIEYMNRLDKGRDKNRSPLANTIAIAVLIILISLPWFAGATWLAFWLWERLTGGGSSVAGSDLV